MLIIFQYKINVYLFIYAVNEKAFTFISVKAFPPKLKAVHPEIEITFQEVSRQVALSRLIRGTHPKPLTAATVRS